MSIKIYHRKSRSGIVVFRSRDLGTAGSGKFVLEKFTILQLLNCNKKERMSNLHLYKGPTEKGLIQPQCLKSFQLHHSIHECCTSLISLFQLEHGGYSLLSDWFKLYLSQSDKPQSKSATNSAGGESGERLSLSYEDPSKEGSLTEFWLYLFFACCISSHEKDFICLFTLTCF